MKIRTNAVHQIVRTGHGMGGFLAPPGHPDHVYEVRSYYVRPGRSRINVAARSRGDGTIASVSSVIANKRGWYPDSIVAEARRIMQQAELTCSDAWIGTVYGYFRNCYSPDGEDRNMSNAIIFGPHACHVCGKPVLAALHGPTDLAYSHEYSPPSRPAAERHLAVLCIRAYFPDHEPLLDLIADPGQGYDSWPCTKCGKRVQYKARQDALCEVTPGMTWKYGTECSEGGRHEH